MLQTTFLACQLVRRVNLAPLLVEMLVCLNKVKSHDLCGVQLVRTLSPPSNIVLCQLISSANYMCKPISWPTQELVQITSSYDWSYWITGIVMPCYQLPSALTPFSPSPRSPSLWPLRLPTSLSPFYISISPSFPSQETSQEAAVSSSHPSTTVKVNNTTSSYSNSYSTNYYSNYSYSMKSETGACECEWVGVMCEWLMCESVSVKE